MTNAQHWNKILFVCARNKIRSYTAEKLFAGSSLYQVRSRGIANEARIKITERDIGWADVIFVMEKNHQNRLMERFQEQLRGKELICLYIEDIYQPMEEALIEELRLKLDGYLLIP